VLIVSVNLPSLKIEYLAFSVNPFTENRLQCTSFSEPFTENSFYDILYTVINVINAPRKLILGAVEPELRFLGRFSVRVFVMSHI